MSARALLVGNLTKDPSHSTSSKGDAICRFGLAVSRPSRDGVPGDPSYYDVTCFGTLALNAFDSLKRGDRVIVEGNQDIRVVKRDAGTDRTFVNVVADAIGPDMRFNRVQILAGVKSEVEEPRPRVANQRTPTDQQHHFDEEPF